NRRPPSPHQTVPGSCVRCEPGGIMPCHVRCATSPKRHRRPSLPMSPPRIVATLDMRNEVERDTQAFLKHACSGRWPMWRLLGRRRWGQVLAACFEWLGSRDTRYSLVDLSLDRPKLCWSYFSTVAAACSALDDFAGRHSPPPPSTMPAAYLPE